MHPETGFSLLELVLVITLLGILGVAVGVIVFNSQQSHITVAAQKVKSDIQFAREYALTKRGTTYGVAFDDATDSYTVYVGTVATPVLNPNTQAPMIEDFAGFPGVSITGGDYTVEFDKFGKPTTGGGSSVQITDGSTTKTITVITNTGRVTIQ